MLFFNFYTQFKKYLKFLFLFPFEILIFFCDLLKFKFYNVKNSEKSFQTFIRLFLITGGWSNNLVHKILLTNKILLKRSSSRDNIINNNKNIESFFQKGYFLKEDYIEQNQLDCINNFLKKQLGYYRSEKIINSNKFTKLNINNPEAVAFHYRSSDLIKSKTIQNLLINNEILGFVQNYLGSMPIIDLIECWWSFPTSQPDKEVAQMWHFDMDRPKWVKVFIFLEDCNFNNGPHCFIEGSHKNNSLPFNIRKMGYSRIEDSEINKYFNSSKIKVFTAKKKTILFEDTLGLHKGQKVQNGKRLILQFQYSSSLFGANTGKILFPKDASDLFLAYKSKYKKMFSNFICQ